MSKSKMLSAMMCLCVVSSAAWAAGAEGLVAKWNFDEGRGDVLRDTSGNKAHGKIHRAVWTKCGDGSALVFDGSACYVDFGERPQLNISGSLTVEAWVKPVAKRWGHPVVIGTSSREYQLVYSRRGLCWWNVGGRRISAKLALGEWNHVAATFDGERQNLWLNGRLVASAQSRGPAGEGANFMIGSAKPPHFRGLLDRVRVYNRALSGAEAVAHFKSEAISYGFDPTWFRRVKVTPYYYLNRGEVVVEADYRGLQPLAGKGQIEVTLSNREDEATSIVSRVIEPLPKAVDAIIGGYVLNPCIVEIKLPCEGLAAGTYVIRVTLRDDKGARPVERITFDYPPRSPMVPSPAKKIVGRLPPASALVPFELQLGKGGGFQLLVKGTGYAFNSRISWPNGDFNHLSACDEGDGQGEESWKVKAKAAGANRYEVEAGGSFYTIHRQIEVFATHVYVKDTFINTTDKDLGLLIYNEMPVKDKQLTSCRLAGYEGPGRMVEMPHHGGASVFVTDKNTGIGMLPMDDVYIIQSVLYAEGGTAGMGTRKFALAPKKSYTLEWAVYPTGSGDYYDFINTFRKVEGRIGTVDGAPGFITYTPQNRRQVPTKDYIKKRALKYALITNLAGLADNPGLSDEGIAFIDFPKERELLRKQAAAIHAKYPGIKIGIHIAHSLYCTNNPDRFADSKVITASGKHANRGAPAGYFSRKCADESWRWYVYYPTPGNTFHDAMMRSVDVLMDEIGMEGAFMDGFLLGYGGRWTYDGRWDGHSAEIDLKTKTIKRKLASVLLLSQPSMIQFARKMHNKGGFIVANGAMMTRSVANEKYIFFDAECQSGPECHLAPSAMSLSYPPFYSDKDTYLDSLDRLSWGMLYIYWNDHMELAYPSLASKQFPMTFEEIRSGLVRGKERIVTMNSGVYGWPEHRDLHIVHKFDGRGAPAPHNFITTVDRPGVRTELKLGKNESAVIQPIPVHLQANTPMNVRVLQYDDAATMILIHGRGEATLEMFVGTSAPDWRKLMLASGGTKWINVGVAPAYSVSVSSANMTKEQTARKLDFHPLRPAQFRARKDGMLSVPLLLSGQVEVVIKRSTVATPSKN